MAERAIYFRKLRIDLAALTQKVRSLLNNKDYPGASKYLQTQTGIEAAVARAGVAEAERGADAAEEAMVGSRIRNRLVAERYLTYLGTIGNNAPFIGLLGTVIGIIKAFHTLSISKNPEMKIIMADIAEALVATGVGLLVAIPAVVAHNYFQRRVRTVMANAETLSHVVLSSLKGEGEESDEETGGKSGD
jgi:biopolymer transport protein ExbB